MRYFLILSLLLPLRASALSYVSLAQQMTLNVQPGWVQYPINASPGFTYRSVSGTAIRTGTIAMPVPVPAGGPWRILLKIECLNNATPPAAPQSRVTITIPGTGDIVRLPDDRDQDGYWTDYGDVTLASPLSSFSVKMDRTDGSNLINVGITAVAFVVMPVGNSIVTSDDYVQTWNLSTTEDVSAPIAGNYVKNAGFEAGISEVSISSATEKWFDSGDMWTTEQAHSGTHSLKINVQNCAGVDARWSAKIRTRPYLVRQNKKHSARVWIRTPDAQGTTVTLSIVAVETLPVLVPPLTAMPSYTTGSVAITGTGWQEIKLEGQILRAYPSPAQYGIELALSGTQPALTKNIYIDDIQLSEGATIPAFSNARTHEVQIGNTKLGGQYFIEDNDCNLQFRFANYTVATGIVGAAYTIWDNKMEVVASGNVNVTSAGNDVVTATLDLNSAGLGLGPFRIRAQMDPYDSVTEMYFSRMHKPRTIDPALSHFGGHLDSYWYQGEMATGMNWVRIFSPNAVLRWDQVEKVQGVFNFYEPIINRAVTVKKPFGTLWSQHAAWAHRHYFEITPLTGSFVDGETVSQTTPIVASGVISYRFLGGVHQNGWALQLINVIPATPDTNSSAIPSFSRGSTITGGTSGATATILSDCVIRTPSYPHYTNYVGQIVHKWKAVIKDWEIENEPQLTTGVPKYTASGQVPSAVAGPATNYKFYGQECKGVMELMAGECPDCKMYGLGGSSDEPIVQSVWNSIDSTTRSQFAGVTMHYYEANGEATGVFNNTTTRAQSSLEWLQSQTPPMNVAWTSESGALTFSQFYGNLANWRNHGEALMPYRDTEDQIRSWTRAPYRTVVNAVNSIGSGFKNHFMYDSRWARWYSDAAASFSASYSEIDLQECLHPSGNALRQHAWLLDSVGLTALGSQPVGTLHSHTRCYAFSGAGDGTEDMLMVHSVLPYELRALTWSLTPAQYNVYDLYGNIIPQIDSTILYSGGMITIKAKPPATLSTLMSAYNAAAFAAGTDSVPPNLVIVGYPPAEGSGALEQHVCRLRWIAWDNIDALVSDNVFGMSFRFNIVPSTSFSTFSPWTQNSFVDLPVSVFPVGGLRTLTVEAKDKAGNVDSKSVQFNW